jgi:hypothetical protein
MLTWPWSILGIIWLSERSEDSYEFQTEDKNDLDSHRVRTGGIKALLCTDALGFFYSLQQNCLDRFLESCSTTLSVAIIVLVVDEWRRMEQVFFFYLLMVHFEWWGNVEGRLTNEPPLCSGIGKKMTSLRTRHWCPKMQPYDHRATTHTCGGCKLHMREKRSVQGPFSSSVEI